MYKNKVVDSKLIYDGNILKLIVEDVILADGKKSKRELVKSKNSVGIIAITNDNKVILVKQYRDGIKDFVIEIPAGLVEDNEDPKLAGIRELEEEAGYKANKIEKIGEFLSGPGFTNIILHLYKATDLIKTKQNLDDEEFLEVFEISSTDLNKLELKDCKTILGLKLSNLI